MQRETGLGHNPHWSSIWKTLERLLTARRGAFALAFIVLASLAFRMHVSSQCSLWLDEASTYLDVRHNWHYVLQGPSHEHPPLMYMLVKLAVTALGSSEMVLRSVSLTFGCVWLIATYELCLELGLSVGRGLVVTATLALCPFFIRHGSEARQYAIVAGLITLATTRALRGPARVRDVIVFSVSALAAAYTHYFALAYALALFGVMVLGIPASWKRVRPLGWGLRIALLLGLLVPLGGVALRAAAVGRSYDATRTVTSAGISVHTELLRQIVEESSFLNFSGRWSLVEPLLALFGLSLLTWRLRGRARLVPFGIGLAPCIAVLFISARHTIAARYLVPSAVFYHLAACLALFEVTALLQSTLGRWAQARSIAKLVGGLAFAAVIGLRLGEFPDGYGIGAADYHGLQRYFLANLASDTRLVTFYGYFGKLLMGGPYKVGSPPIQLEKFRPVPGIERYLVAEIHIGQSPERNAEFEAEVERQFGLSPEAWRALPLVPLPHSRYQPAVGARLVQLPADRVPPKPKKRRPHG